MDADTSIEDFEDTRSHFDPSDDQHADSSSGEEEVIIPHPLLDDLHPDTIDVVVPPTPPSPPIPLDIPIPVHDPPAVVMAEGEDPMAAFKKAIVDAFQEANRNSTYPMPSFAGKKERNLKTIHFALKTMYSIMTSRLLDNHKHS